MLWIRPWFLISIRTNVVVWIWTLFIHMMKNSFLQIMCSPNTESFQNNICKLKMCKFSDHCKHFLLTQIYMFIQGWWFSATGLPVFILNHCSRPQWGHKNTRLQTSLNNQFAERQWRFCPHKVLQIYKMPVCNKSFSKTK